MIHLDPGISFHETKQLTFLISGGKHTNDAFKGM